MLTGKTLIATVILLFSCMFLMYRQLREVNFVGNRRFKAEETSKSSTNDNQSKFRSVENFTRGK